MTTDTQLSAPLPPGRRRQDASARRAKRHPLLGAFPVAVMTLATFLVVFAILMARLQSGVDPALGPSANRSLAAPGSAGATVVTRASGGSAPAGASGPPARRTTPAVTTRASGSRGGEESDDA